MSLRNALSADEILDLIENGNVSDFEDGSDIEHNISDHSFPDIVSYEVDVENGEVVQGEDDVDEYPSEMTENELEGNIIQPSVSSKDDLRLHKWRKHYQFQNPDIGDEIHPSVEDVHNRAEWSPIHYFQQYVTEDICETMALNTNLRSVQNNGKSLNVSKDEVKKFIGAGILMASLNYPQIRMFWKRSTRVPMIANSISRQRFFDIRSNFKCVNDNDVTQEQRNKDKLWKVRPLLDAVRSGCLMLPRPKHMSIDEQMIPFTGNTSLKQYVKGKPNPVGLKNFVLASPSGLVLDFCVYQGKGTSFANSKDNGDVGIGESAVIHLCETVPPASCIYTDRYFTSHKLVDFLIQKSIYVTGTIQINRAPNVPLTADKELSKQPRGSSEQFVRDDGKICLIKWYDNKGIIVMSSCQDSSPVGKCRRWCKREKRVIEIPRPNMFKCYNEFVGGVDLNDRMIAYYRNKYRTNRWTLRTILHFIDLSCVNAWFQYREDCKIRGVARKNIMQFLNFRILLAEELITGKENTNEESSEDDDDEPPRKVVKLPCEQARKKGAVHLPEVVELPNPQRCRREGCHGKSRTRCIKCKVFLCLNKGQNCFVLFHS